MSEQVAWADDVMAAGQTIIWNYVLDDTSYSLGARMLFILLCKHAGQSGSCYPGQERLAEVLDVQVRRVQHYLRELKGEIDKNGEPTERPALVSVERRGKGRTNVYLLHAPQRRRTRRIKKNDDALPATPLDTSLTTPLTRAGVEEIEKEKGENAPAREDHPPNNEKQRRSATPLTKQAQAYPGGHVPEQVRRRTKTTQRTSRTPTPTPPVPHAPPPPRLSKQEERQARMRAMLEDWVTDG